MNYLQSWKIRLISFTIILLCTGIFSMANICAHQGCQDAHKDKVCPEHGVPESGCASCNPAMKNSSYEELLKKTL
ncbi:MAG: hypothetical protein AYP45_01350 [Candidatus Brocadia carolinensis]|uniref:Uncharacterized protein n=1 Tax=Candidatus Brocadia carolinensis TaxID=1004156 RepID=A0A1V4AXF7_9BACT|nr:MAG: hypothetical protein AYP45_01350 [Candidatus Brocadia caroliniensis]